MDRCHNCNASLAAAKPIPNWEAVCPECGQLTWLATRDVVECTVTTITRFGMFVEFGDRVEGIIHISELSNTPVEHPSEIFTEGDLVAAVVLRIDLADRKIGMSVKRVAGR